MKSFTSRIKEKLRELKEEKLDTLDTLEEDYDGELFEGDFKNLEGLTPSMAT